MSLIYGVFRYFSLFFVLFGCFCSFLLFFVLLVIFLLFLFFLAIFGCFCTFWLHFGYIKPFLMFFHISCNFVMSLLQPFYAVFAGYPPISDFSVIFSIKNIGHILTHPLEYWSKMNLSCCRSAFLHLSQFIVIFKKKFIYKTHLFVLKQISITTIAWYENHFV